MAIKVNVKMENGITVNGAYVRVNEIIVRKDKLNLTITKHVDGDKLPFETIYRACDYDLDGSNPFIQAYEYLKTLEEFAASVDC